MSNEFDAKIRFGIEDTATPKVTSSTQSILKDYRNMRNEIKATRAEFELQYRTLTVGATALRGVGNVASSVTSIYTAYNVMQLRISDANKTLRQTQDDYTRALAENGPGSKEAIDAARQLADAKKQVAQAQQEEILGSISMGFQLASTVSLIIQAIPKIKEFAQELKNASTAGSIGNAVNVAGAGGVGSGTLGGSGKIGTIAKIGAGVGGAALIGGGVLTSQALSKTPLSATDKLMSVGEQAAGGALLGATIGSVVPGIGTAIGALGGGIAGGVAGVATNFGDELKNFFSGKGFTTNPDQNQVQTNKLIIQLDNNTDNQATIKGAQAAGIEVLVSNQ